MLIDECNNHIKGKRGRISYESTERTMKWVDLRWQTICTRIYTSVGIIFGLFWIGLGIYIDHADVIEHFKDIEEDLKADFDLHEAAIIDVDDFERVSTRVIMFGIVVVFFSVLGHMMTFFKWKIGMVIFCAYLFFSFVGTVVVGTVVLKNGRKIMEKIDQDSIRFWRMAVHPLSPIDKFIRRYEEDHNCCGWNNAIDYCDQKAVENLMMSVIDEGITEKIIQYTRPEDGDSQFGNDSFEDYVIYSNGEYEYSYDSDSNNNHLRRESAECTDDGYDGDEGCICDTISQFNDDADVQHAVDRVKTTICVHESLLCYYFDGPFDNGKDECNNSLAMPWTESEGVTRDVPLDKVCHETTCFLNGCGDIFSIFFRKKILPCLSALAVISGVFYVFGMAISITLTYKIWSTDQHELSEKAKRKIKARTEAVRNKFGSFRETSTRRTDCEEMPLNAN